MGQLQIAYSRRLAKHPCLLADSPVVSAAPLPGIAGAMGGEWAFGYDALLRQTFYGCQVHALVAWPRVMIHFGLAQADLHETALVPDRVGGTPQDRTR